ncbi:2860_t:CDS:1, partial [Entrophospora sp. SA101]
KILTWGEKKQLCEFRERNPSFTYKELGRKFEVAENTVCNILKDKNKWLSTNPDDANKQKYKAPKYPELESSLMIWFNQALSNKRVITGDVILAKAKRFAELLDINDFKGSDGWVSNFKKRNGIKQYNLHGEASSAPSEEIIFEERRKLQEILSEFPLEDVYNCDET